MLTAPSHPLQAPRAMIAPLRSVQMNSQRRANCSCETLADGGRTLSTILTRSLPVLALVTAACTQTAPPSGSPQTAPSAPAFTHVPDAEAAAVARSIVLCKTTEAELRARLGPPSRDGILHGSRVLAWFTMAESPFRYLAVLVDARGVVADVYWDVPVEVPWVPTDQCSR